MLRLELGTVRNTELGLLDPLSQEGFVTIILSILIALLLFYFFFHEKSDPWSFKSRKARGHSYLHLDLISTVNLFSFFFL